MIFRLLWGACLAANNYRLMMYGNLALIHNYASVVSSMKSATRCMYCVLLCDILSCVSRFCSQVLRLICIQSICNDGLKPKVLDFYKREIIQTYGFEHVLTLSNLEMVGMLRSSSARNYQVICKSLKLLTDDVNLQVSGVGLVEYSGESGGVRCVKVNGEC